MASSRDTYPRITQSPVAPALRPRHISVSPLSFSRSAPATNLSTPSVKRRCVSTGSIPSAGDPFSNTSNSSEDDDRHPIPRATGYPTLPDFQVHRNNGSPSTRHTDTLDAPLGPITTPSRPSRMRNRTVSDTAQLHTPPKQPEHWSLSDVDAEIEHWIRNPLTETERNETGVGNNYTFEATLSANTTTPGIQLVKIGYTSKRPRVRAARIQYECGDHEELSVQDVSETVDEHETSIPGPYRAEPITRPVRLFRRVEKLAHAQLKRHVHIFTCKSCGHQHREYFQVDIALAHGVQGIWRDFVLHEPYDAKGYLTPFWEMRLRAWQRRTNMVDAGIDKNIFHKQLQHWGSFANPYLLEFLWHDLTLISAMLWTRKWQSLVFLQGFIIACLTFPSFWAFMCFAGLALAILVEACFGGENGLVTRSGERLCSLSELVNGVRRVVKLLAG